MRYDPSKTILAGMDTAVLTANLAKLQQIYLDLSSGQKGESFSYAQGDGSKAVTYSRANISQLTMAIRQLQAQLGVIEAPRRAMRVYF